jgi:protein-S-isoprenylcysteine O-methyltransferase Ste14
VTFFNLALGVAGLVAFFGGAWPLLSGKNFPGVLGSGFTRGDNLRLKRAPATYFRAMGATITSAGVLLLAFAFSVVLASNAPRGDLVVVAIIVGIGLIGFVVSAGWLIVLAHRYKLFRWNVP